MKMLQRKEREQIGYSYIIEQLEPITPYGKDRLNQLQPYNSEKLEELEREFQIQQALMEQGDEAAELRKKIELLLMNLKEVRGSIRKSHSQVLTEVDFFELKNAVLILEKIIPLMSAYVELTGIKEWEMGSIEELLKLLDPEGERIPSFYISNSYHSELGDVREAKRQIEIRIRKLQQSGESKEDNRIELDEAFKQRESIVEREEALNRQILERLSVTFLDYEEGLVKNLDIIGHVDMVWQKINFYKKYHCIRPEIGSSHLSIEQMVQPEIQEMLKEKDREFTPLSMEISPGVCVITGANMGGKSVTIKTAGLMVYMAYCGFFVPAKVCKVPAYDEIYLIMDEYEETSRGLSSFGGEIIRLRDCLNEMGDRRCLVLMDEPARGTNPEEGAKIVQALVRYLRKTNSDTFLATHYEHIGELADTHYQVYGLKRYTDEELQTATRGLSNKDRIHTLSRYMDYGVYPVSGAEPLPQDAIRVCRLLGLQEEILQELEGRSL